MQKRKPIKSKKVRDSARGEECTLNIAGVCNHDSSTTILAHLPDDSGCGKMAGKSDDVGCAVYACSACHDKIDGRTHGFDYEENRLFYTLRALKRTIRRMIDNGTITIGG